MVRGHLDPLWVAELVADEAEVGVRREGVAEEPTQLVQRHAALHHRVARRRASRLPAPPHVEVHGRADETEGERLVAYQALVVALGVREAPFLTARLGQGANSPYSAGGGQSRRRTARTRVRTWTRWRMGSGAAGGACSSESTADQRSGRPMSIR